MSGANKPKPFSIDFVVQATQGRLHQKDQTAFHDRAIAHADKKTWIAVCVIVLGFMGSFVLGLHSYLIELFRIPQSLEWLAVVAYFGAMCLALFPIRRSIDRLFRSQLQRDLFHNGVRPHFCIKCDYDLKGSDSLQCPECGAKLAPLNPRQTDAQG